MCLRGPPDGTAPSTKALERAYLKACLLELRALKPGNVHIGSAGHGMTVAQFEASARASSRPLCAQGLPVGRRIRDAIAATHAAVGCNTNLGIVLLAAPLIAAAERAPEVGLPRALDVALGRLTIDDAAAAYEAIRLAAPAGLGHAALQDVAAAPSVDFRRAMALAADRDRVARQYATGYADVFTVGVPGLIAARRDRCSPEWGATRVYMQFLASFADSHIQRKHGVEVAEAVRREAEIIAATLRGDEDERVIAELMTFDRRLKGSGLNPGTSADLTVASLLALGCEDMLHRDSQAHGSTVSAAGDPDERPERE
jgi:triphosphoribosyl-dephospho-CoA synthase